MGFRWGNKIMKSGLDVFCLRADETFRRLTPVGIGKCGTRIWTRNQAHDENLARSYQEKRIAWVWLRSSTGRKMKAEDRTLLFLWHVSHSTLFYNLHVYVISSCYTVSCLRLGTVLSSIFISSRVPNTVPYLEWAQDTQLLCHVFRMWKDNLEKEEVDPKQKRRVKIKIRLCHRSYRKNIAGHFHLVF